MALSMPTPNGRISATSRSNIPNSSTFQPITLDYDPTTYGVTLDPVEVPKNTMICFKAKSGTVRVVFLSPFGDEIITLLDSQTIQATVGGCYHFKCFFTPAGGGPEIESTTGGVIDVQPHRP